MTLSTAPVFHGSSGRKSFINDEAIADIREKIDIAQIVTDYVRLLPSGHSFKGLCPFHQEKTPSFYVVPEKQIFHCFGCGKGGDVFRFIMEIERLPFPEAVRHLARRIGVSLPEEHDPEAEQKSKLHAILDEAAHFFTSCLFHSPTGDAARAYLKQRGITAETVRRFRMGFAPDRWDALIGRLGRDAERMSLLGKAGLIKPSPKGSGHYDTFRNRLMIPILDLQGRVTAFGGRVMVAQEEPKYLNSPETDVFSKRRLLFNLKEAQNEIRRENSAIVVEGYLDVISLVQAGIGNVVATLGTAITPEQIGLIARNCDEIYFCYDADAAGQRATLRAISINRESPLNARVVTFLDPKDDPDSFVRREGGEAFLERLRAADDIYTFLIESRTRSLKRPLEIHVKERLISDFRGLIPAIGSSVAKSELIKRLAGLLDMDQTALQDALQASPQAEVPRAPGTVRPTDLKKANSGQVAQIKQQEWVLRHLLDRPSDIDLVRTQLKEEDFRDPLLRKLYVLISSCSDSDGKYPSPAQLLSRVDDESLASRLSELMVSLEDVPPHPFQTCVNALMKSRMDQETHNLPDLIRAAEQRGDWKEVSRLMALQLQLRRRREVLPKE